MSLYQKKTFVQLIPCRCCIHYNAQTCTILYMYITDRMTVGHEYYSSTHQCNTKCYIKSNVTVTCTVMIVRITSTCTVIIIVDKIVS